MSEFHFSPRANRAHEIAWMPWDARAFERAERESKPVLLSISAVWCHWCHVMDETTYSDPAVIASVNERFVPVRIDNDERPDINARYNMGGWPTTAFLAPDGSTITGATYLPPDQMVRALTEIAQLFDAEKDVIASRATELRGRRSTYQPATHEDLNVAMVTKIVEDIADGYDTEFGGFGNAPKFPQPDVLELLLLEWRISGNPHLYEMVARTMREMSRGGMYDHVEGGFFRYSTTRDWSVPHFEKMAEDHAGLLRVLAQLVLWARTDDHRATLVSAIGYVRSTLRDPRTQLFAGSQDADEHYFTLGPDERRAHGIPFIDRRSYTNWTAALAGAWLWASRALDDDGLAAEALATLDALHDTMRDVDGLLYHVAAPGEAPRVRGLLCDQSAYLRALLDAHETTGEERFFERARTHADLIVARFGADDGGFYDHASLERQLGRLDVPDRPIGENGVLADSLLRLSVLAGETGLRTSAQHALALFARTYAAAGSFASTYARALRRYLAPELSVKLVGPLSATEAFREAARRLPSPFAAIRSVEALQPTAAYVCAGSTCAPPISEAGQLRAAYDTVA